VTLPRNGTCQVNIRFVPTVTGNRSAALTIDPTEPAAVNAQGALTGRGVAPPPAPAAGPPGPAGRDAIVTCKAGRVRGSKVKVRCTVRLAARATRVSRLVRRGKVYARGRSKGARGSLRLRAARRITRGRYTLFVRVIGADGRSVTIRQRVIVR
jgi:hypothetical protein